MNLIKNSEITTDGNNLAEKAFRTDIGVIQSSDQLGNRNSTRIIKYTTGSDIVDQMDYM